MAGMSTERVFGGLWKDGPLSYAVRDFFQNGGKAAVTAEMARKFAMR